jgi:hypothetical protein
MSDGACVCVSDLMSCEAGLYIENVINIINELVSQDASKLWHCHFVLFVGLTKVFDAVVLSKFVTINHIETNKDGSVKTERGFGISQHFSRFNSNFQRCLCLLIMLHCSKIFKIISGLLPQWSVYFILYWFLLVVLPASLVATIKWFVCSTDIQL